MARFFVDLYEMVWKQEIEFLKLHWRGYSVIAALVVLYSFVSANYEWFKEKAVLVCGKFKRK
ncbi:MAG: hypothetical protein NC078_08035 [Ruminococcus sp.]|nr:hypothetical protein [Ruminococcus sp.]